MPGSVHRVVSPNSTTDFEPFGAGAIYVKRRLHYGSPTIRCDITGPFWLFIMGSHPAPGLIRCKRHGELKSFSGLTATLLPPFSLIEWHMAPCSFEIGVIVSTLPMGESFTKEAATFTPSRVDFPKSLAEVESYLAGAKLEPIGFEEQPNILAARTKTAIDRSYAQPVTLGQIARQMKQTNAALTRAFKRCYGITPVKYRTALRIAQSQFFLLSGKTVTEACASAGFADLSQFNRQFYRSNGGAPSQFRCNDSLAASSDES